MSGNLRTSFCRDIKVFKLLRREGPQIFRLSSRGLGDTSFKTLGGNYQVLPCRNFTQLISGYDLVAVKSQSKLRLTWKKKNCYWKIVRVEGCNFLCNWARGK